jgi:hypothetical protein
LEISNPKAIHRVRDVRFVSVKIANYLFWLYGTKQCNEFSEY